MSPALAVGRAAVSAALAQLPSNLDSRSARAILLTIGLQESLFLYRRQMVGNPPRPTGPATSFWQAEVGGGMVRGVRLHPSSAKLAAGLYALHNVQPTGMATWSAIERNDVLAAASRAFSSTQTPARSPPSVTQSHPGSSTSEHGAPALTPEALPTPALSCTQSSSRRIAAL